MVTRSKELIMMRDYMDKGAEEALEPIFNELNFYHPEKVFFAKGNSIVPTDSLEIPYSYSLGIRMERGRGFLPSKKVVQVSFDYDYSIDIPSGYGRLEWTVRQWSISEIKTAERLISRERVAELLKGSEVETLRRYLIRAEHFYLGEDFPG